MPLCTQPPYPLYISRRRMKLVPECNEIVLIAKDGIERFGNNK